MIDSDGSERPIMMQNDHWQEHFFCDSNSLEFPKPAGPCPETRLARYKPKGVIQRLSPSEFRCSHDAASRPDSDGAASPRRRRLRAGQWELFFFFHSPGSLSSAHFW